MSPKIPRSAFTIAFSSRVNVLSSQVGISEAYDPNSDDPQPLVKMFYAIWDTGASGSVINKEVISDLHLQPIDKTEVHTANGKRDAGVYLVNVYLPNKVVFSVENDVRSLPEDFLEYHQATLSPYRGMRGVVVETEEYSSAEACAKSVLGRIASGVILLIG